MKTVIVLTLYFVGALIYFIWYWEVPPNAIEDEDFEEVIDEIIKEDPDIAIVPENIIRIVLRILMFATSFIWPYHIIKVPIKAIKNLFN